MMKRPGGAIPGERQVGERNLPLADRRLQRPREVGDAERAAGRLARLGPCVVVRRGVRLGAAGGGDEFAGGVGGRLGVELTDGAQALGRGARAVVDVGVSAYISALRLR